MRGRHRWKQVMFRMKEHGVGDKVQPTSALRPPWFVSVASVVHGPNGEEACETLADQHRADVPTKRNPTWPGKRTDQEYRNAEYLRGDPGSFAVARESAGGPVQPNEEERPDQDGLPPGKSCGRPLAILCLEAMTMMMQMGDLDGMHRGQHHQ